jgi:hypothetical protein
MAFDLDKLLIFHILVLHLLRFSVPRNDKLHMRIFKLSLLKGLTFNPTLLASARLTGFRGHKSLMRF